MAAANQLEQALGRIPEADRQLVGELVSAIALIQSSLQDVIEAVGLLNRVDTMRAEQIAVLRDEVRLLTDGADAPEAATIAQRAYWGELAELRQQRASQKAAEELEGLSDSELVKEWETARARRDALRDGPAQEELTEAERYASQLTTALVHRSARSDAERWLAEGDDQRDYAEERSNAELLRDEGGESA